MNPESVQTLPPATDADGEPTAELREHLAFQRSETHSLRTATQRLAHELALSHRLLASFLPAATVITEERWPETFPAVRLPASEFATGVEDLRFTLDDLDRGTAQTHLRGWAFAPGLADCAAAATTLLFVPTAGAAGGGTHLVGTKVQPRPDVAAAFAGLTPAPANLDHAGFVATVFHPSVARGEYELFLHVEEPGVGAVRRSTDVRLVF